MADKMADFPGKNGRRAPRGGKSQGALVSQRFALQFFLKPRGDFLPNHKLRGYFRKSPLANPGFYVMLTLNPKCIINICYTTKI